MNTISFSKKIGTHGLIIALLSGTILSAPGAAQEALPTGGKVVSGKASISTGDGTLTVDQKSDKLITNWKSFSIGKDNSVIFNQPNSRSVALNRVIGQDPSLILGSLIANGSVFLVNPNSIVIGKDGSVQTGGFVGSTLGIKNSDFRKGNYTFKGSGGAILNQGDLEGGIVALIAPRVQNDGSIMGSTALAGGTDVTLDFDGDGLIGVEVNASTLGTLVENRGVIKADGDIVFLTAKGANDALRGIVNNSGVIEASSLENRDGRILLLGDMKHGTVNAAGTLEASFVETSAARVNIADGIHVKTNGGKWLIDPNDFTIAASGGNITGATLSNNLANGNVTIPEYPTEIDWKRLGIRFTEKMFTFRTDLSTAQNLITNRYEFDPPDGGDHDVLEQLSKKGLQAVVMARDIRKAFGLTSTNVADEYSSEQHLIESKERRAEQHRLFLEKQSQKRTQII